jgi:uncharacterized protein (DUF1330 family)
MTHGFALAVVAAMASFAAAQQPAPAKGYLIIEHGAVTPEIAEKLKPYSVATRPLLEKFGARFIVASGGARDSVEGGWTPPFLAVIEFPSYAAARTFYTAPEYQAVLPIRQKALPDSKAILIEGTPPR